MLAAITAYGRANDPDHLHWETWLLSYIVLCFPELETKICCEGGSDILFKNLPFGYIDSLDKYMKIAVEEEEDSATIRAARDDIPIFPDFPEESLEENSAVIEGYLTVEQASCTTIQDIYAYCAILLYMAGERPTELDTQPIIKEIIDNYHAYSGSHLLTGAGKLNPLNSLFVTHCWLRACSARRAIFREVAAFSATQSLPQQVVYSVVKYISYRGMESAVYIHEFLQAFP